MSARKGKAGKSIDRSSIGLVLRLYVAGNAPNSAQAVANLDEICREYLNGSHKLEIIDVLEHPQHAMAAGILVTPTLEKLSPLPAAQVIGNLSDKPRVLLALGIRDQET